GRCCSRTSSTWRSAPPADRRCRPGEMVDPSAKRRPTLHRTRGRRPTPARTVGRGACDVRGMGFDGPVITLATVNVNGIRAAYRKGMGEWVDARRPDILALQEVRAPDELVGDFL